jgi:hypothetical protein
MHEFILQINPVVRLSSGDEPTAIYPGSLELLRGLHWKWRIYG